MCNINIFNYLFKFGNNNNNNNKNKKKKKNRFLYIIKNYFQKLNQVKIY